MQLVCHANSSAYTCTNIYQITYNHITTSKRWGYRWTGVRRWCDEGV